MFVSNKFPTSPLKFIVPNLKLFVVYFAKIFGAATFSLFVMQKAEKFAKRHILEFEFPKSLPTKNTGPAPYKTSDNTFSDNKNHNN